MRVFPAQSSQSSSVVSTDSARQGLKVAARTRRRPGHRSNGKPVVRQGRKARGLAIDGRDSSVAGDVSHSLSTRRAQPRGTMMASIIHGRLRLPAHIRLSVAALVGMVGLVVAAVLRPVPRPAPHRTCAPAASPPPPVPAVPPPPRDALPRRSRVLPPRSPHRRVDGDHPAPARASTSPAGRRSCARWAAAPAPACTSSTGSPRRLTAGAARRLAAQPAGPRGVAELHPAADAGTARTPSPWRCRRRMTSRSTPPDCGGSSTGTRRRRRRDRHRHHRRPPGLPDLAMGLDLARHRLRRHRSQRLHRR